MDRLKRNIADVLMADARTPYSDIAAMTGATEEEVAATVMEMERDNTILKYTTIVREGRLNDAESVTALIEVKVSPQREIGFDSIARRIYRFDEVESVFLMSGAYDLMVMIKAHSMREIAYFVAQRLSTIDGVLSTATHFVLQKYKELGVVYDMPEEEGRLPVSP
ncbi:Lrp/AsnC family transcriptional regulator [Eubacteriales bacterium OttesenSCG-928-M02]|nr:Lrp/AsnC family transcriptional regulator [Eubacteriales bacterium OttesenSCG-928-M02]